MQLSPLNRQIIIWIGIILTLYLIHRLASVLIPFLISFGLAYLGNPLVQRIESPKISRTWAVSIVFGFLLLGLTLILLVVIPILINQLLNFIEKVPTYYLWVQSNILPKLETLLSLEEVKANQDAIKETLTKSLDVIGMLTTKLGSSIGSFILGVIGFFVSLFLIPMITFYVMRDWPQIMAKFETLLPRSIAQETLDFLEESNFMLSSFLRGQFTVMLALAFVYSVGLSFVGLEYSVVIGITAGLISFIPYLGATSGILMGLIVAWFQFGDITHLILVGIVFGIGQLLESFALTPILIGDKLGMHPIAVVFALMVGGSLFGFVGILLALPACAVLMVALRKVYRWYLASDFYQDRRSETLASAEAERQKELF